MIRLEYEDYDDVIHIVEITEIDGLYKAEYWIDGEDVTSGAFQTTVYDGATPEESLNMLEEKVTTTAWRGGTPSFYEPFKYFRRQI